MIAWLLDGIGIAACLYLAAVAFMYWRQRSVIYRPDPTRRSPGDFGLSMVREVVLPTPEGERLVTWWAKAPPGRPTVLYLHGNAGHLYERAQRVLFMHRAGIGILMLAYRGYSGSSGQPSEAANVADAVLAFDHLRAEGVDAPEIVLFGESLGTGVAVQVACQRQAAGLVLDSPFTSLADVGAFHFPWLPVGRLLVDRYDSLARIGTLWLPLLIVHGEADDTVPVTMGRKLFEAANEPKRIVTFPGAPHIQHAPFGSLEVVRAFIDGLTR